MPAEEALVLALIARVAIDSGAARFRRCPRHALRSAIDAGICFAGTAAAAIRLVVGSGQARTAPAAVAARGGRAGERHGLCGGALLAVQVFVCVEGRGAEGGREGVCAVAHGRMKVATQAAAVGGACLCGGRGEGHAVWVRGTPLLAVGSGGVVCVGGRVGVGVGEARADSSKEGLGAVIFGPNLGGLGAWYEGAERKGSEAEECGQEAGRSCRAVKTRGAGRGMNRCDGRGSVSSVTGGQMDREA